MRRILVIGSGGAGKSTLARRLGERLGLPVVHLDAHYWRAGWVEPPKDEWARTVRALADREAWVMDGNYGGTLDLRLAAADTVVFLDLPRRVCLWRVLKRWLTYRRRTRPDMGPGCPERLTWAFVRWIWVYPHEGRRRALRALRRAERAPHVIRLRSPRAVRCFLAALPYTTAS